MNDCSWASPSRLSPLFSDTEPETWSWIGNRWEWWGFGGKLSDFGSSGEKRSFLINWKSEEELCFVTFYGKSWAFRNFEVKNDLARSCKYLHSSRISEIANFQNCSSPSTWWAEAVRAGNREARATARGIWGPTMTKSSSSVNSRSEKFDFPWTYKNYNKYKECSEFEFQTLEKYPWFFLNFSLSSQLSTLDPAGPTSIRSKKSSCQAPSMNLSLRWNR